MAVSEAGSPGCLVTEGRPEGDARPWLRHSREVGGLRSLGLPGQEVQQLPSVARSCPQGAFVRAGKFDLTERALVTYCLGTWCTDGRPPRIVTVALTVLAGNFALKRRGCPACRQPVGACRSWTAGERKASLNASGRAAHVRRTGNSWAVAMRPRLSVQRIEWRIISKSGTCRAGGCFTRPNGPAAESGAGYRARSGRSPRVLGVGRCLSCGTGRIAAAPSVLCGGCVAVSALITLSSVVHTKG